MIISGLQVYTENEILKNAEVVVEEGVIRQVTNLDDARVDNSKQLADGERFHFPETYHLIPGFIDMHVHGAKGFDVMDATEDALAEISLALAAEGTTSFLATTMTADESEIENALRSVKEYAFSKREKKGATILGVHLEGPFLSSAKMGAQRGDKILSPNAELMLRWQALAGGLIRLVTLAPEQPNSAELIAYLKQENIIPSLGHTNATYAEAVSAIDAGCCHATHLFNAMRGIQQREPGVVTAALLADNVMAELIVDGHHLHPAIVELALRVKGKDKIILVTDAMRAKCMGDGVYELGGQAVYLKDGKAALADGTLAGSVLPMISAIQNMLKFTGCSLADAVQMASENPAKALGIFHSKGSIKVGKDADLVVLDEALNVVTTFSTPATFLFEKAVRRI